MSLSQEEVERLMRVAYDTPGWYGIFRTSSGYERVAVPSGSIEIGKTDPDSGLTDITVTMSPRSHARTRDLLGGAMCLGVFHPDLWPEPEGITDLA